jgi:cytoskeletal protein CcmA (bactofilin family)
MLFGTKKGEAELEVIIGVNSSVKGDLDSKGVIRIDGSVTGNISADWIIIGSTGVIIGNIAGRGAVIDGHIEGNITLSEITEIKSNGDVRGEIHTTRLSISEGAFLKAILI